MSKVYADAVTATEANQDLTLGGSGDNVIVTAGATLKTNTVKDSGGNTLFTSDGAGTLSSLNSAIGSTNMVLLSTQTASDAASLSFTSSITGAFTTYKLYIFKFIDIHPRADNRYFGFQANATGQSGYNEVITSSSFASYGYESGGTPRIEYRTSGDQSQGTANQNLGDSMGGGADENLAGEMFLFNPSSTTYVKHFYSRAALYFENDYAWDHFVSGYINVTAAIIEIQFKMTSGNMDGTIKLYGVG